MTNRSITDDFGISEAEWAALVDAAETIGGGLPDCDCRPVTFNCPPNHMVYFVGGETGPVKIGFTQQPLKERLKCIQNGSPIKLRVLATQNAPRAREAWYHRYFASARLHGEWFERTPAILAEIARLSLPREVVL